MRKEEFWSIFSLVILRKFLIFLRPLGFVPKTWHLSWFLWNRPVVALFQIMSWSLYSCVNFSESRVYQATLLWSVKEQFPREYHVVCIGKQTTQVEKGYSFAGKESNLTKVDYMIQWFFQLSFRPAIEIKFTLLASAPRLPARIASLSSVSLVDSSFSSRSDFSVLGGSLLIRRLLWLRIDPLCNTKPCLCFVPYSL